MTANIKLKEAFEIESKHGAFYTGGNVEWHSDTLFCQTASSVSLLNTQDGTVSQSIGEHDSEDSDHIHTFTTDGESLVTSHKSGLLKLWTTKGELAKVWKAIHKGPIAKLALNRGFLASGGSDAVVRLWDLGRQTCVLALKGCQGVVNTVQFHPQNAILASGDDGRVLSWDASHGSPLIGYNAHFSKVTSLVLANEGRHFVTSGRDKVLILWEFGQGTALRTIPVHENVEVIVGLPEKFKLPGFKSDPEVVYVASGGERGLVRVWDVTNAKEVYQQDNSLVTAAEEGGLAITKLLFREETKTLAVVTADHNIILHNLKSFVCLKQFVGFTDEILDVAFVRKDESHLAVATNSVDIKLYDSTMNCQLLKGHSDIVLCLATDRANPDLMLSGGKDNQVRLWRFEGSSMSCVGVGHSHTASVGSVAFLAPSSFLSASQDTCLKLWRPQDGPHLSCVRTEVAHLKDVNCVAVSPNGKIVATASQDKTAKLWTESLTLVGVLRGHRRGVWSVAFSPVDQVVATSSADCSVKLWSVADLRCLKTLEGHESSVLRAAFVSQGMQILSSGADGLVKLFAVKTSECVGTFEGHEGRVWALAVRRDETGAVTGGSDSLLVKWADATEARRLQKAREAEEAALQQQQLANCVQSGRLLEALRLALRLDRPLQVLRVVKGLVRRGDATGLAEAVKGLEGEEKERLLRSATEWNTNGRNCQAAQLVLHVLLGELQTGDFRPAGLAALLEGAMPYTDRHFKRLTQLLQDLHFLTYTINCIQPHIKS